MTDTDRPASRIPGMYPTDSIRLPAWITPPAGSPARSRKATEGASDTSPTSLLLQRRALDLFKVSRFAEAQAAFDGLLATEPGNVDWLFLKAVCLLELRQPHAALAPLAEAERLAPWDSDVQLIKANALLALREYDGAGQVLTKLLAADAENPRVRYHYAGWAALTGRPHRTLTELRRLIAADSGFREEAATDPAFAGMRRTTAFRKLLAAEST